MEITKVFLTGRPGAGGVNGNSMIAVGVEGKQLWKDTILNLKHALVKLFGNPPRNVGYRKESYTPYVWPLEGGIYTWGGNKEQTPFEVFEHWQKYKMHTRIMLKKDGTFTIRKPGH